MTQRKTKKNTSTQKHLKKNTRNVKRKAAPRRAAQSKSRKKHALRKWQIAILILGLILLIGVVALHIYSHPKRISSGKYQHAARFSNHLVIDGIDVSYAQGDASKHNWNAVKRAGVDFVFIRAGYRDSNKGKIHKDDQFEKNIQGATKAGLMVGAYFYSQATSKKEATEEATALLKYTAGHPIDLPLVMDYEIYPGGRLEKYMAKKKYTTAKGTAITEAFCQRIRNAGYEPSLYSNYSLLIHQIQPAKIGDFAHVWMANYNTSTDYPHEYTFWQASFEENVNGIPGTVDRNFWYFDPSGVNTYGKRNANAKSIEDCTIQLEKHSFYYLGRPVEPKVIVKDGSKTLREGQDYQVGYIRNTAAGTGYAIVTGLGNYKDMTSTSFRIKTVL